MKTIKDIVNEVCFNCHDKGEVLVQNEATHGKLVLIPCPICANRARNEREKNAVN